MYEILDEKNLNQLIEVIEKACNYQDLSDGYLIDHNQPTRHSIGVGEYAYGITMVPASWVLPYLKELQNLKGEKYIKSLEETKDFIKTDKSGYSEDKIKLLENEITNLKNIIEKGD